MSSASTQAYPPPPPGLAYLAAVRPSLNMLILGAAWSSTLVPLLCALFLFSTKRLRRTPIFILNVISILMGSVLGILNYYMEVTAIMSPQKPVQPSVFTAYSVLVCLLPLLTESILVVRVLVVYPPRELSRLMIVTVYVPLFCMKAARLINISIFWHVWFPDITVGGSPITISQKAWNRPFEKVEWILQMCDNGYASALFLWRLRRSRQVPGRVESSRRMMSYVKRLNSLFWIATSNFVLPVMLSFAQLIFAFKDSSYLDGAYVMLCNVYVEIIGVLLATVWSSGTKWSEEQQAAIHMYSTSSTLSAPRFGTPPVISTKSDQTVRGMIIGRTSPALVTDDIDMEMGMKVEAFRPRPLGEDDDSGTMILKRFPDH